MPLKRTALASRRFAPLAVDATSTVTSYHHGDLRNALIEAALLTLARLGDMNFSLSEIARGSGVTPAAAYKHFADKDALLHELAAIGFARLAAAFEDAAPRAKAHAKPVGTALAARKRFVRIGQAYVAFGVAQPALFMLMFGKAGAAFRSRAAVNGERTLTFSYLVEALDDLHRLGVIRMPQLRDQWFAWSSIHGATELAIAGINQLVADRDAGEAIATHVMNALSR